MIKQEQLEAVLSFVEGWLSPEEAHLLYTLASNLRSKATIVEIGSYRGRSTIALALGAKESNSRVYSIDPHHIHESGGVPFGPADNTVFMSNLLTVGVADQVNVINVPSERLTLWGMWSTIDLLFIDGAHEFIRVNGDFHKYGCMVTDGMIAVHDSTGAWDGPTRVVQQALEGKNWCTVCQVGQITVLKRIK